MLPRCGNAISLHLKKIGISTIEDLLHHFPMRYEDHSHVSDVKELVEGSFATVRVRVAQLRSRHTFRRGRMQVTEGLVSDETGSVRVVWFGQSYITKTLAVGDEIFLSGKVKRDGFGLQFNSPAHEKTSVEETVHTARVVPIYGLKGLDSVNFERLLNTRSIKFMEWKIGCLPKFWRNTIFRPMNQRSQVFIFRLMYMKRARHASGFSSIRLFCSS
jgi:ATP-dependent DNA helicase RecG